MESLLESPRPVSSGVAIRRFAVLVGTLTILAPWVVTSVSAVDELPEGNPTSENKNLRLFPPRLYYGGTFYLPKAGYWSHRGLGLGLEIYYPYRWSAIPITAPASDLKLKGWLTTKLQGRAEIESNIRLSQRYATKLKLSYDNFSLWFYGIGPNTPSSAQELYRPQSIRGYGEFFRRFGRFRIGFRAEFEDMTLVETEPGGLLDRGVPPGTDRTQVVGGGLTWDLDFRERRGWSTHGFYASGFALFFADDFGSDHGFDNYNNDLRAFLAIDERQSIAFQFFHYSVRGAPPFWRYAALGGREHTRGYRRARYIDRLLLATQAEYRTHFYWRFGLAGFAGLGDVAPSVHKMELEGMRGTVGFGIHVRLGSLDGGALARLDVAFGEPTPRFYLNFGEAF